MPQTEGDILVVDDDAGIRETLADFLDMEGYSVRLAKDIPEARTAFAQQVPDLFLLDLNVPGGGGLAFATEVRATSDTPIIMISGKGEMVDRVVGLEVGADDYLAKPFELRELLARMRAVLRRTQRTPPAVATEANTEQSDADALQTRTAKFGNEFALNLDRRQLQSINQDTITLTGAEFNLLQALVERPNRVLSRDTIADIVYRGEVTSFDRSIDTLVSRLRKKLDPHTSSDQLIQTVRGEGYVLASSVTWDG